MKNAVLSELFDQMADIVIGFLEKLPSVEKLEAADSLRRRVETIGAVDFFDYSIFTPQRMRCNDPEDPNCTPNW